MAAPPNAPERDRDQTVSWDYLAPHLGNDADNKRYRQTVRETMQIVSSVYPNAKVDVSGRKVILHPSPAPVERKLVGAHPRLVGHSPVKTAPTSSVGSHTVVPIKPASTAVALVAFPTGSLSYGDREKAYRSIGLDKGHPWEVDAMAAEFRRGCPDIAKLRTENEWLRMWEAFVVSYAKRRARAASDD